MSQLVTTWLSFTLIFFESIQIFLLNHILGRSEFHNSETFLIQFLESKHPHHTHHGKLTRTIQGTNTRTQPPPATPRIFLLSDVPPPPTIVRTKYTTGQLAYSINSPLAHHHDPIHRLWGWCVCVNTHTCSLPDHSTMSIPYLLPCPTWII